MKEVKKDRDGIRKDIKKLQKEKSQLPLNGSLPLSGTQELTLDPLRGENAAEGKNQLTHLPLSSTLLGLGPLFWMTSSSDKRIKTLGSKRKDKEPDRSYSNKFLSRKHERHFNVVQDRRLLKERKAGLIHDFAPQFGEQLENRNWGRLATNPAPANIGVVKYFYTNARRLGDHPVEDYLSYVRGHAIRYDPDSINKFLDTKWVGELCQFALNMEEGVDFGDVESVLYITVSSALLLYCVLRGMSINIGQLVGVNISTPPFERPRKEIDEAYYRQYCGGDEAAQPVPPRHPRRGRRPPQAPAQPHDAEPFQMRDMYMSLIDAMMQSIHKGQVATAEMIIGMYDTPQDIGGPWMSSTMWWHGQSSKLRELEQLKLQLWMLMINLKMLKMKERRKIQMTSGVDEELR
ncbi:hypothetical protein LR48_Vigan03g112900 [Vigna angularis]|uniref:Putative plant transposon protein domain-containing protein n=1 Tax=Phaseolus angularis TaxID=3914 RepID=A0A0L9U4Z2_PHAAN|nr:hypothetical protein LR48_Vigan03g112900 [Vigna angularis]